MSDGKVKLNLTVFLGREQAERLTARAIRNGKNLETLVAEILEAASEWSWMTLSNSWPLTVVRAAS